MQPSVLVLPSVTPPVAGASSRPDLLVIGLVATGQERLRAALRRVAADPELLGVTARIVVVDAGRTPSATVLREAVRLPTGLLRVVRRPDAGRADVLSSAIVEALEESRATSLLLVDDTALTEPQALLAAFRRARGSASSDVVGLRDPAASALGPASWWGAVLPLDAVRAIGAALPEAGEQALAELVLRAESTGYRSTVLEAPGPVPEADPVGGLLLALLHAPASARTPLIGRELVRLRPRAGRGAALRALLAGPEPGAGRRVALPLLRLWLTWPALRRRYRSGALDRASAEAWTARFVDVQLNPGLPHADRETTTGRPAALRSPAWSTTKRGTSAA
jgi:hypothetical protein